MGLTTNVFNMISSVAENDLQKAKRFAKMALNEDKTEKNRIIRERTLRLLESDALNMELLPHNLKGLLIMEDVSMSFIPERYYVTMRERALCERIQTSKRASDQLNTLRIRHLNATLLTGVSGTGKTTFGRYLAYTLGLPFAYVNFSRCIDSYMGSTGKNIANVFDFIMGQECVFMVDELDAIGSSRGNETSSAGAERNNITIGVMQAIDKLPNGVILLGATNRPGAIDKAIKRRFSSIHEVTELSTSEACSLVDQYLASINMSELGYAVKSKLTNGVQSRVVDLINDAVIDSIIQNTAKKGE